MGRKCIETGVGIHKKHTDIKELPESIAKDGRTVAQVVAQWSHEFLRVQKSLNEFLPGTEY